MASRRAITKAPAVFARLLGEQAGHWSLRPADH